VSVRALLGRRGFRALVAGQGVSALGDWMGTFAFMALALDLTGPPTAVGGILTLRLLPAVVAGPLVNQNDPTKAAPVKPRVDGNGATGANLVNQPAQNMTALLALQGGATGTAISDTNPALMVPKECNPEHGIYTVTRLANTATVRSNVYAVWITVREITGDDPDTIRLHRGFAIVDRSVPVAHEPGRDHNVRDAIVLRRVIE